MEDIVNTFETDKPDTRKKMALWKKVLIVFAIFAVVAVAVSLLAGKADKGSGTSVRSGESLKLKKDYIGELSITDTISEYESSGFTGSSSYHHDWLLDRIDDMIKDSRNKGLILYMDSPGGSVYASDEMYLKVMEYKQKTGRPVVCYFASQAASGAYYIASASDKIAANRNCWTGSIGVTLGTMYDVTDLLEKHGIKTVTITSGRNKAMGSSTSEMSEEQREILQSLVDEAYDQFVGIVAEGRHMSEKEVRKLADGRIYTAAQAKDLGLVDAIATHDEAVALMKKSYGLEKVDVEDITYKSSDNWVQRTLYQSLSGLGRDSADNELSELRALMGEQDSLKITYLAPYRR